MNGIKTAIFLLFLLALPLSASAEEGVNLSVPHLWEIPDGRWVPPWSGACEEASIIMVENFYTNSKKRDFSASEAKALMRPLFSIEDKLFGSNLDTNSTRTLKIINDFTSFDGSIKENPTLDEIKDELRAGRPVISLHYGRDLDNPLHRWRQGGSSYHMMVINGFDEGKKEFLINDPELKAGLDFRYKYDTIMASLRDFNHVTKKADGSRVVLFTKPKQLVRAQNSKRIFIVRNGTKHLITTPRVFKNHRWSWTMVKEVAPDWLNSLPWGESIDK